MKIGFLPFYIKLYDEVAPALSAPMRKRAAAVADEFRKRGFSVIEAPVSRVVAEFFNSVSLLEQQGAEAILTLHLAYSPSLEAIDALTGTSLPLVILDTTPDYEFGFDFGDKLMSNHGIHGVQDLCNLLLRRKKTFLIAAGHGEHSSVYDDAARLLHTAAMANKMTNARVGVLGGEFAGMGDFRVPDGTFGMQKIEYADQPCAVPAELEAEIALDRERYIFGHFSDAAYAGTLRASLKLRRWIEKEKLDAFTISFPGITRANGFETVPFLECSKALARGIGYAGEGDVLTAVFISALMASYPQTTFLEMFCPDWKNNRIFTSHMGEVNLALTESRPLLSEREYIFSDTGNPVVATGCLKKGNAILANLAPGPDDTFTLIAGSVEFQSPERPSTDCITGWFRPADMDIADFLRRYSELGGTHHLAAVYGGELSAFRNFARLMRWNYEEIC